MGYQGGSLAPALAKRGQISQPGPGTQYCGFPTLGVVVGINEDADTIDVVEKYGNKSWWGIKPGDMVTPEGSGSGTFPTVGTEIVIDIGGNGNCIVFARGGTGGSADGEKPVAGETVLSAGGRAKLKLSPNGGTAYGSGLAQIVNSPSGGQAQFSKTLDMGSLGGGIKTTGTDPKGAAGLAVTGNEKVGDVGGGAMLALGGKDGAILATQISAPLPPSAIIKRVCA